MIKMMMMMITRKITPATTSPIIAPVADAVKKARVHDISTGGIGTRIMGGGWGSLHIHVHVYTCIQIQ